MTHTITVKISADDEMVKQFGEHRVGVMPTVFFECSEPDDAWCRRNLFGPGEGDPSEMPGDCSPSRRVVSKIRTTSMECSPTVVTQIQALRVKFIFILHLIIVAYTG